MPTEFTALLVIFATAAVAFAAARLLSRRWRTKRRDREQGARRAAESRQVRRARERRGRS
jgi:uncharacterized membrane protein YdjX (TVP38/TMEM64 family)